MSKSKKPAKVFTVALIESTRCYGGPEEGGWYYDFREVLRQESTPNRKRARRLRRRWDAEGREIRAGFHSVECYAEMTSDPEVVQFWPSPPGRPHYE